FAYFSLTLLLALLLQFPANAASCPACGGACGKWVVSSGFHTQRIWMTCPTCGGSGRVPDAPPLATPSSPRAAGQVGSQIGRALGNALFGGNDNAAEADRLEEERRRAAQAAARTLEAAVNEQAQVT